MVISCFRPRHTSLTIDDDRPRPARRPTSSRNKTVRVISRQGSDSSRISATSTCSNESISKLPPCKRESDAKIESMMMPVPHTDPRHQSRCLRLSHPKIYGNIVSEMKSSKGCRDWRNFAVFYNDDVDMSITADEAARQRAIEYQRKVREMECLAAAWSCSSPSSERSIEVDMIG